MKEIDWEAVLEELQYELRQKMGFSFMYYLNDERNPYTFEIFDLQERIGLIEKGNYEEVYNLLVEEWGEDYFDDYLI